MPDGSSNDLGYRPKSYWGPQELAAHYGVRIKGELRRRAGMLMLDDGVSDPVVLQSSLSDDELLAAGRVHPSFMGGEYLPDLGTLEVEIARVTVASTMMDVISFRARKTKRGFAYKIVDEYPEDGEDKYPMKPKTSTKPLTLKQMIQAVNGSRIIEEIRGFNYEWDPEPETYYNFCTVSSEFYDELGGWFDKCNEEWLERELELRRDEREEWDG